MSLIARHLEAAGIPTVCIASALDIIQSGQPPRTVFVDYPLGHTTGRPFDSKDQKGLVKAALEALVSINEPGQIITLPAAWSSDNSWLSEVVDPAQGDVRQPRDTTPRYQFEADRVLAEGQPGS